MQTWWWAENSSQFLCPNRTHFACTTVSTLSLSLSFFSCPSSSLAVSPLSVFTRVIPLSQMTPLARCVNSQRDYTQGQGTHWAPPVWRVWVEVLPDPLMLINWPKLWGFEKVPWGKGQGGMSVCACVCVFGGFVVNFRSTSNHRAFQKG